MQSQLFDAWPEKYTAWFSTPIGQLIKDYEQQLMLSMLQPNVGETIADIGCGSGIFTLPTLSAGANVVGLDLSQGMLKTANQCLSDYAFTSVAGDMLKLPFADAEFDKVVSITALEFVADAQTAMDELFRITRPGGRVVLATLNSKSSWAQRRSEAARKDPTSLFNQAYFRSPEDLNRLARRTGRVQTAIHFDKGAAVPIAQKLEEQGQVENWDTGAFVIGCWHKP